MLEKFSVLSDIAEEFRREIRTIDTKIAENQQCITEADMYIGSLLDSETEDFKVFSPRKAEVIHREDLERAREKKAACENANERFSRRRELLSGYIEKLENILDLLPEELPAQQKTAEDRQKEYLECLEHLTQRLETAGSHIEKRPVQAKQELAVMGKYLKELTDKIRQSCR